MPKSKESLRIEINQSTSDNQRMITVTVSAPVQDFLLPDLLTERKAIRPLDDSLKAAVRTAIETYLGGAEELVAGLAANRNSQSNESKPQASGPKQSRNGNDKAVKTGSSKRDVTAEKSSDTSIGEHQKSSQAASISGS